MFRAIALATPLLALAAPGAAVSQQELSVLRITITIEDADRHAIPVARHMLLVSDNPSTAIPRRIVTSAAGTAELRVRPGNYTVESDRPVALLGRSYQWTQIIDVAAGRDATLELTAANALVETASAEMIETAKKVELGGGSLLTQWQNSVVSLWTDRRHASGFVVDTKGLVVTSQKAIGDATSVEVQISPSIKVMGRLLAADPAQDVAVLSVAVTAVAGIRPIPLACDPTPPPATQGGPERYALEVSMRGLKDVTSFARLSSGAGGPVFGTYGTVIGLTSPLTPDRLDRGDLRVVPLTAVCDVLTTAQTKLSSATPPDGALLPVEPRSALAPTEVRSAAANSTFTVNPYRLTSADFDIVFITPQLIARAESRRGWMTSNREDGGLRAVTEFGDWSDYVEDMPPVLFVRVTPRLIEGLWMKVARGAAVTQGVALPPIKRLRPGFSNMRLMCGDTSVTPIHPLKIEQRLSDNDGIIEGFYAFDPASVGAQCGTVSLVLSSVKEPDKTSTTIVPPSVLAKIAQDFAALTAPVAGGR